MRENCTCRAPLRAVVPGHVGVRNVKWLTGLVLSSEEAPGPWQRGMAYKVHTLSTSVNGTGHYSHHF
jgi:DMSO/TMAO reductase YedYZ molybdopterin-dependent catalytic subunit